MKSVKLNWTKPNIKVCIDCKKDKRYKAPDPDNLTGPEVLEPCVSCPSMTRHEAK